MHGDCNLVSGRLSNWQPARLIYIGGNDDNIWKLCTRTNGISTVGYEPYMTLSYRWGTTPEFLLRSENINLFMQGLPIDDLPKTFRDAVLVAKHFSVKYIWIDTLCISQDSQFDWAAESPNMQHVYGNSICNIAACTSTDQDSGFFSTRDTRSIFPCIVDIPASDGPVTNTPKKYAIYEKDYWCRQLQSGSIHSRGWIFQECLLAPRVLYFTKDQILWKCSTITRSEGFPTGIPYNVSSDTLDALWDELSHRESAPAEVQMSSPPLHRERINELWKRLVEKYTECDLSVASDKLPAFEGIARLFKEITHDEYAAGLWQSCLVDQLNWFVLEPRKLKQLSRSAATWSWASIDGPVKYMKSTNSENSLISEGSNTIGSDHLIGTDHSSKHAIHLRGMIHACTVRSENETIEYHVAGHTFDGTCYLDHLDLDLERDFRDISFLPAQSFSFCTTPADDEESHQIAGLVLRAMRSPSRGIFERIGYFITSSAADVSSMGIDPINGKASEQYGTRRATTIKMI